MSEEKLSFQAEVSRLLDIVANALYSNKEIFLRELISNASDACDRLRYAAITEPGLTAEDSEFQVTIAADKAARSLTIADNGIGMNREELIENLGTIARSGTAAFMDQLDKAGSDLSLIGQFGVGFYSAFMVAEEVEVTARKAGDSEGWHWVSNGQGEFTIGPAEDAPARGTRITLKLKKGEEEYLEPSRLRQIVKTYSDHIAIPVVLASEAPKGDEAAESERLNAASAIWARPKSEISDEQYKEFYHHVGHGFDDPWLRLHFRAEGVIEYTGLLYVPSAKPFDLFDPTRQHRVKLYVRRVFITDDCAELLPAYLRFLRGVIDTEDLPDLPLNISRELLQRDARLAKIRSGVVKRVLGELKKKAEKAPEEYRTFWDNFGAVLSAEGGPLRGLRPARRPAGPGPLPLDRRRGSGRPERLSGPHEGRPGGDLLHHRRGRRDPGEEPAARGLRRQGRRGAAADRPGRRVLGPDTRRIRRQALQVRHPRRCRGPGPDQGCRGRNGRGQDGGRDPGRPRRPDRLRAPHPQGRGQGRALLGAPDREPGLPGR
jgi:HSP90 family molecular chaperone